MKSLIYAFVAIITINCRPDNEQVNRRSHLSDGKDQDFSSIETFLRDGENADPNYQGVLPIYISKSPEPESLLCSGSLIKPNVMLTSATCVDRLRTLRIQGYQTFIKTNQGKSVDLNELLIHPSFHPNREIRNQKSAPTVVGLSHVDIALVSFKENLNLPYYGISTKAFAKKHDYTFVGFGENENGAKGARLKGKAEYRGAFTNLSNNKSANLVFTPTNNQIGCQGDSGSPLFVKGEELGGVLSFSLSSKNKTDCNSIDSSTFTATKPFRKWIVKYRDQMQNAVTPKNTKLPLHNKVDPNDVNNDGSTDLSDALAFMDYVIKYGVGKVPKKTSNIDKFPDVTGDNLVDRKDLLELIDTLEDTYVP